MNYNKLAKELHDKYDRRTSEIDKFLGAFIKDTKNFTKYHEKPWKCGKYKIIVSYDPETEWNIRLDESIKSNIKLKINESKFINERVDKVNYIPYLAVSEWDFEDGNYPESFDSEDCGYYTLSHLDVGVNENLHCYSVVLKQENYAYWGTIGIVELHYGKDSIIDTYEYELNDIWQVDFDKSTKLWTVESKQISNISEVKDFIVNKINDVFEGITADKISTVVMKLLNEYKKSDRIDFFDFAQTTLCEKIYNVTSTMEYNYCEQIIDNIKDEYGYEDA